MRTFQNESSEIYEQVCIIFVERWKGNNFVKTNAYLRLQNNYVYVISSYSTNSGRI